MRTKTPRASPAVTRDASATPFGGRDAFGGMLTWGRHVPCQPQAMGDKSFRLGPQAPRCRGSAEHGASTEYGAMQPAAMNHTWFRPGPQTPGFCAHEAIASPLCIPSSHTSPVARQPGSCPSPPKGREGARRADEGGRRIPTTNRVPHQKPTVRERECWSPIHVPFINTRARTRTPRASPAVTRDASATPFGGRDAFGGLLTWGRHVPCQPQALVAKPCKAGSAFNRQPKDGWRTKRGNDDVPFTTHPTLPPLFTCFPHSAADRRRFHIALPDRVSRPIAAIRIPDGSGTTAPFRVPPTEK